ncbi:MAG: hypothetical protein ACP5QK_00010 [Myxococcota bacterium]
MSYNNGNNNKNIVLKSGSDEMRAFYDFCIDFMVDENIFEEEFCKTDGLLNWLEEPEIFKMAIADIKNRKLRKKP